MPFDSCSRQAVANYQVARGKYQIVVWEAGQKLTNNFRVAERNGITNFLSMGGNLFVSGADLAWDLDRAAGPTAADRAFLNNWLHADFGDGCVQQRRYLHLQPGYSFDLLRQREWHFRPWQAGNLLGADTGSFDTGG